MYSLASARDPIIAIAGCESTCGNVSIAYPFGMKHPKCFAHKWFEIECNNASQGHQKPYLKTLKLEVTYIDVERSTVGSMNPIFCWNCQSKNARPVKDLKGRPFVYSQGLNTFMAVGCNNILAFLQSNGSVGSVCASKCDYEEAVGGDGCHSRCFCTTIVPFGLSEYNATLQDLRNQSEKRSYELIASDDFLHAPKYDPFQLQNIDYAPAVLDWEIPNDMLINSTLKLPSDAVCYDLNIRSLRSTASGRRCECLDGYYGNPYIERGCIGI